MFSLLCHVFPDESSAKGDTEEEEAESEDIAEGEGEEKEGEEGEKEDEEGEAKEVSDSSPLGQFVIAFHFLYTFFIQNLLLF